LNPEARTEERSVTSLSSDLLNETRVVEFAFHRLSRVAGLDHPALYERL
jgi:hypothetical protein